MNNLTTPEGIKALMASSTGWFNWLDNCAKVKAANGWTLLNGPHWIYAPMFYTPAPWHQQKTDW